MSESACRDRAWVEGSTAGTATGEVMATPGVGEPMVRTSFVGTWEVFILPRQSNRGSRGKEDSDPMVHVEVG